MTLLDKISTGEVACAQIKAELVYREKFPDQKLDAALMQCSSDYLSDVFYTLFTFAAAEIKGENVLEFKNRLASCPSVLSCPLLQGE